MSTARETSPDAADRVKRTIAEPAQFELGEPVVDDPARLVGIASMNPSAAADQTGSENALPNLPPRTLTIVEAAAPRSATSPSAWGMPRYPSAAMRASSSPTARAPARPRRLPHGARTPLRWTRRGAAAVATAICAP